MKLMCIFVSHTDQKYRLNSERKKKTQSDDFTHTRQSGFCSFLLFSNHNNTLHTHNLLYICILHVN